jgi:hypothetical protein
MIVPKVEARPVGVAGGIKAPFDSTPMSGSRPDPYSYSFTPSQGGSKILQPTTGGFGSIPGIGEGTLSSADSAGIGGRLVELETDSGPVMITNGFQSLGDGQFGFNPPMGNLSSMFGQGD